MNISISVNLETAENIYVKFTKTFMALIQNYKGINNLPCRFGKKALLSKFEPSSKINENALWPKITMPSSSDGHQVDFVI